MHRSPADGEAGATAPTASWVPEHSSPPLVRNWHARSVARPSPGPERPACQPACHMSPVSQPVAHDRPRDGSSAQAPPRPRSGCQLVGNGKGSCDWGKTLGRSCDDGLAASRGAGRPAELCRNLFHTEHSLPFFCHLRPGSERQAGAAWLPHPLQP